MPSPLLRLRAGACVVAILGLLGGCSAAEPASSSAPSASATAAPAVIPTNGLRLAAFGYTNGPTETFSLPRTTVLKAAVDQPNNVSTVIGQPRTAEVYAYLLDTLPTAGFEITDSDAATTTLTFAGQGWSGSFTGDAETCAVLLRPA